MKIAKITAVLLAFILGLTLTAAPLAEEAYGAQRLMEDKPYEFHEVMRAALEETRLRLLWLTQAGKRFPGEPLFGQALEAERERAEIMRQQFAAWGFAEEPAEPPFALEVPPGFEQALKAMRDMAERGMMMSMRLEEHGETQDDARFQAHMWGHEYRDQLDGCDLRADELGYAWAWQYENEEPFQEQNREMNGPQGESEPAQVQNQEQNQEMNGPQGEVEPAQEQNQEQIQETNGPLGEGGQNQQGNGNGDDTGGKGKKGN